MIRHASMAGPSPRSGMALSTIDRNHQCVARRNEQSLAVIVLGKELCLGKDLFASGSNGYPLCDQAPADGRPQAVHRKMRRDRNAGCTAYKV